MHGSPRVRWHALTLLIVALLALTGCDLAPRDPGEPADPEPEPSEPEPSEPPVDGDPPAPVPDGVAPVGVGLGGLADWSTQWPFVDAFMTSREWIAQRDGAPFGQGGELDLTPEGWVASLEPGQYADTVMLLGDTPTGEPAYPTGEYTLLYEGQGEIGITSGGTVVSEEPGRMVVDVTLATPGVWLRISATDPADPIRDIRFVMPGFVDTYETEPFHPLFLERIRPFAALRFMDWMATNDSLVVDWSERATPDSARQTGPAGVAAEYIAQLSNTAGRDPWVNIPAPANDAYVRSLAELLRDQLDAERRVYVEYSNEVWNGQFDQHHFAMDRGVERGFAPEAGFEAVLRHHSQRTVEIGRIFDEVLGEDRVVTVMASQQVNPWVTEQVLTWQDAHTEADAIATAAYFNTGADPQTQATAEEMLDGAEADIAEMGGHFAAHAALAERYGLDYLAYEAGQHFTFAEPGDENDEALIARLHEANRDPRMGELYQQLYDAWSSNGGGMMMAFVDVSGFSKWGAWGALEWQAQPIEDAPKYATLIEIIAAYGG